MVEKQKLLVKTRNSWTVILNPTLLKQINLGRNY